MSRAEKVIEVAELGGKMGETDNFPMCVKKLCVCRRICALACLWRSEGGGGTEVLVLTGKH